MTHPGKTTVANVDASRALQTIDGFGVNINSRYWDQWLLPAMDLLLKDLGATLYRVDIWGKSNWLDPDGRLGRAAALEPAHQAKILDGEIFRRGWGMMRWLNEHGIKPYLTASGIVPPWMLGADGKTLVDFDAFADMMVTMLDWAKRKEGLDFTLFGPLNETDIGDPEGPTVGAEDYVRVCEVLDAKLRERKLDDVKLVVAEQAHFNADYLRAFAARPSLKDRIGVFALHDYSDISPERYREVTDLVSGSAYAGTPLWMTEFGDLEQSGDREWYVAWIMASRLFDQLEAGFTGALVWDAYDNYHDHNEYWTIYGLLRTGLYIHTPKKRYHAMKQVFQFVRPGFRRVAIEHTAPDLRLLAFADPDGKQFTVVGINRGEMPVRLIVDLSGLDEQVSQGSANYYRTSETENCALVGNMPVTIQPWPHRGIDIVAPSGCIFTLTNAA